MESQYVDGLVSVIIPTYKRSDMLERAIDSVLNQTYTNIELLVVNDNERNDEYSKKLYQIIEKYDDRRLHFIEQESHINGAVARNVGIRKAHGQYVAFLDDDDYWDLDKIDYQVRELQKLDETWGAVSCLKVYYRDNQLYRATMPYKDGYIFNSVVLLLTDISTPAILMRHCALDDAGYFDETLERAQDLQLYAFFSKKYKIKLIRHYLLTIDASDTQNRPPVEKLIAYRQAYAKSVDGLMNDQPQLRELLRYHIICGEGISLIRSKKFFSGLSKIFSTLKHPSVIYYQSKMYYIKLLEGILKTHLLMKYKQDIR